MRDLNVQADQHVLGQPHSVLGSVWGPLLMSVLRTFLEGQTKAGSL